MKNYDDPSLLAHKHRIDEQRRRVAIAKVADAEAQRVLRCRHAISLVAKASGL